MNINSEEYIQKYGSLVQFGISYMLGFSQFADTFIQEYNNVKPEIDQYGGSSSWVSWQRSNYSQIMDLYDQLNQGGLIPTSPI